LEKTAKMIEILHQVEKLSEAMLVSAKQKKWDKLALQLEERESLLRDYEKHLSYFEEGKNKIETDARSQIREQLSPLFDKITKVNQKIFDIIDSEKEKIFDEIIKINKGLEFLKDYERKTLSKSLISKLY